MTFENSGGTNGISIRKKPEQYRQKFVNALRFVKIISEEKIICGQRSQKIRLNPQLIITVVRRFPIPQFFVKEPLCRPQ